MKFKLNEVEEESANEFIKIHTEKHKYTNTTIHSDFLVEYNNNTYIIEYNGK